MWCGIRLFEVLIAPKDQWNAQKHVHWPIVVLRSVQVVAEAGNGADLGGWWSQRVEGLVW